MIFKNIPSKICGRQRLKRPYHFKFFKGCLPQILLGPFLNTLSHILRLFFLQFVNKTITAGFLVINILVMRLTAGLQCVLSLPIFLVSKFRLSL